MDEGYEGYMAQLCVSGDGQAEEGFAGKQYLNLEGATGECTSLHRL